MDPVIPLFITVTILGLAVVTNSTVRRNHKKHRERILYEAAYQLRDAWVEPCSWVREASLHYNIGDYSVEVSFGKTKQGPPPETTKLCIRMREPFPTVTVMPHQNFLETLNTALGSQDIEIGYAPFDEDFRIQGGNTAIIQSLFPAEVCNLLFNMGKLLLLKANEDEFTIELHRWMLEAKEITSFIRQGVECHQLMRRSYRDPYAHIAESRGLKLENSKSRASLRITGHTKRVYLIVDIAVNSGLITIFAQNNRPNTLAFVCVHNSHDEALNEKWGPAIDLANPVIARMVRIHSPHSEHMRSWVNREEIYEAILPIVHGFPESSVTDRGITLMTEHLNAEQLGEAIDLVITAYQVLYLD